MPTKSIINGNKKNDEFIFVRMDTLIERLRRMRALNSTPANIGLTHCTMRSCGINKTFGDRFKK